jgi:hypothetical protein
LFVFNDLTAFSFRAILACALSAQKTRLQRIAKQTHEAAIRASQGLGFDHHSLEFRNKQDIFIPISISWNYRRPWPPARVRSAAWKAQSPPWREASTQALLGAAQRRNRRL